MRVFDGQGNFSDHSILSAATSFIIDNSGPEVIEELGELKVQQDIINFGGQLTVSAPMQDRQSGNIKYVNMTFESETGANQIDVYMDRYQWGGGNDIYAADTLLPDIGEGGLWSIKSLTAEDELGNISIYEKANFSDSAISSLSFRANNLPVGKATIVGSRALGNTLVIDPTSIIDYDNSNSWDSSYQSYWQIKDENDQWKTIYSDSGLNSEYTLTEKDANKFFRTLTTYTDGHGFSESVIGNEFKFTEHLDIYNDEDFENGAPGWVRGGNGQQATTFTTPGLGGMLGLIGRGNPLVEKPSILIIIILMMMKDLL